MSVVVPSDYAETLESIKRMVHEARYVTQRRANAGLLRLYWHVGAIMIERQRNSTGWGSNVVGQLADDLRAAFPSMKGFSRSSLFNMRRVAEAWPDGDEFSANPAGQIPWTQLTLILDKVEDPVLRDWYAAKSIAHGWSRQVLRHQIETRLHDREGAAPSNYLLTLERGDSALAQELTRDPYTLDFLAIDGDTTERELESRLMERIIDTLRELGPGFAFVGRQIHFEVGGDDFYVDMLFFHTEQLRYVVIELKTTKFDPSDAGQLGFYVGVVESQLRRPQHNATVGMLLVADKNDAVVRYALAGTNHRIAISRYDLSPTAQAALPPEEALTRALALELDREQQ